MDGVKADNERELTSTMGNVLSMSSKDEKNDTSDATPTSSTDANTTPTSSRIVSDDPISSTSSDITEQNKSKTSEANMQNSLEVDETTVDEPDKSSTVDPEADLLEMSISNVSNEKITEDVEDLVHDLESLLGESTDSFNIPIKRKEDRKSPSDCEGDKEDINSTDESQTGKLPDEKGDAESIDEREINNQPQTTSAGIQEVISSDETIPEETDQDTETKMDEIVPDENIISTQSEEVSEEVEENNHGGTSETYINQNRETNVVEPNEEISEQFEEAHKEIDKEGNKLCPLSDKEQENPSNSEASEAIEVDVACKFITEEASGNLPKENCENVVEVEENVGESTLKEPVECVVATKDESSTEEQQKEGLNKQVDKYDVVEQIVENSEIVDIGTVEKCKEKEIEDMPKCSEIKEYPQDVKENEVSSVIEDIPTSEHEAQENELQVAVECITNVSENEDTLNVKTVPTATNEIESCDKELNSSKAPLEDNEQFKENEVIETVEETPVEESAAKAVELKEIDTGDIEKQNDAHAAIAEDISESPKFDNESKTMEQSVTQKESVEVDPGISDAEQCKEECGQVDGTVTENEESKLQVETASNKEIAEHEAGDAPKPEEIPSQSDDEEITEPITEDVGKEINEEPEVTAVVTESESQNIPESTVEILAEDTEPKVEDIVSHISPQESSEEVIDDAQCSTSPNANETISIQPVDEPATSSSTEMDTEEPSREMETSESPIAENTTPEVSADVEPSVSPENKEMIDLVSQSEQVKDDTTEPVQTVVENVQLSIESERDIPEECGPVENPKSPIIAPSESTEETVLITSEETKAECVESLGESAEDSTEIGQSESKETIQPVVESEVSKDIATVIEPESAVVEKVDETEGQSLGENREENIPDEGNEEPSMETGAVEATNDALAEVAADTAEIDSGNMETEDITEVNPSPDATIENKTTVPNDELSELTHDTPIPNDESRKENLEASSTNGETPLPVSVEEPYVTNNDISDSANESSTATENISEATAKSVEETSNSVEETSNSVEATSESVEETSKTDEKISDPSKIISDLDDISKSDQETTTNKSPESDIESMQDTEDSTKLANENVIAPVDLMEEGDREKSSSEEMIVEPSGEDKKGSDKIVEISDEDSKAAAEDPETIQVLSSSADSDSEEVVPVLVLEPDEDIPSPKQLIVGRDDAEIEDSSVEVLPSDVTVAVTEPLPEIEDILADQGTVDEVAVDEATDLQENLETILAVASLQNIENEQVAVETSVEPEMSEKERREMEALRKAVESITENTTDDFVDDDDVVELITEVAVPEEDTAMEPEIVDTSENLLQVVAPELEGDKVDEVVEIEKTESTLTIVDSGVDNSDEDVVELKIEESVETVQVVEEDSSEENTVGSEIGNEADENLQALPDTSEDKVTDSETRQFETKDVLPDSSQSITLNDEARQSEASRDKETKTKSNERPKRHKKSSTEELSINVDVPDKDKPYSPKVTIKPIKVPDEEVSTTSNSDSEICKGSLKMTITKQSDKMHSILKICDPESSEAAQEQEEPIPKLIIKPKMQQIEQQHSPKMSTRSSRQVYSPTSSTQRSGSPRITIKPVVKPEKGESISPLKIKIKPDDTPKKHNPKVNIKPITKPDEDTTRESVQSPRKVIIKPVVKPVEEPEQVHSPRITIKPIPKPEAEKESTPATPRLNIKPIKKQEDDDSEVERERSSPKITIKPVVKPQEPDTQTAEGDEEVKERIVLKINKGNLPTPTKDSKKREHPPDDDKSEKLAKITVKFSRGGGHPHIVQQSEESNKRSQEEQSSPEKVKKQKTEPESPISTRSKHKDAIIEAPVEIRSKHKDVSAENPTGDAAKPKQKENEPAHESPRTKHKDPMPESPIEPKRTKLKDTTPEVPAHEPYRSRHKETTSEVQVCEATRSKPNVPEKTVEQNNENADDVKIVETKLDSPIVISEDSRSQDSGSCVIVDELKDPLSAIPVFEITAESAKVIVTKSENVSSTPCTPPTPVPRKRGRPRKVPIVVREDFKEQEEIPKPDAPKEDGPPAAPESGRPKRSCRGQSARATLGIKPRKPRGPGRGRGSKRGMGTRTVPMKPEGEVKLSKAKLKLMQQSIKEELAKTAELASKEKKPLKELEGILASDVGIKPPQDVAPSELPPASPFTIFPVPSPQGPTTPLATQPGASPKSANSLLTEALESATVVPIVATTSGTESSELVMVDEETRMSADTNSRAQTPAKQVIPADAVIEESQSSVQSTATTESGKARPSKAPRLEVQEPEGAVISADQLTEYYWNGNGPFMLQEQVAQFLGIKSFKRKYPGIMRRMLEMQERDFIRESGLASEHMCDLGLTAVNSADILDIMYSDFQDKYEEYCKHQRDRQAKDLINKQKALTLAASQEKNKADITEQAVQSAAQWNANFNKTRKEQRKACMDLQTLTVHYPKGKIKQINKAKVGNFPVALVPGQFTDYYQEFTPTEINNLPINTMCYDPINIIPPEESDDSGSEGSDSDSDSSSSSSGSGSDSSSGVEDCKLCKHSPKKSATAK